MGTNLRFPAWNIYRSSQELNSNLAPLSIAKLTHLIHLSNAPWHRFAAEQDMEYTAMFAAQNR
jgi:hypothetical protein